MQFVRLNYLCAQVSDLLIEEAIVLPASLEKTGRPKKKRKTAEDSSAIGGIRRTKAKNKSVKKRGFFTTYSQSSVRAPIKAPLECTVRKTYLEDHLREQDRLDQPSKPLAMRTEVPAWWGKLPEMLAGAGITLSEWRQRILDEEDEDEVQGENQGQGQSEGDTAADGPGHEKALGQKETGTGDAETSVEDEERSAGNL